MDFASSSHGNEGGGDDSDDEDGADNGGGVGDGKEEHIESSDNRDKNPETKEAEGEGDVEGENAQVRRLPTRQAKVRASQQPVYLPGLSQRSINIALRDLYVFCTRKPDQKFVGNRVLVELWGSYLERTDCHTLKVQGWVSNTVVSFAAHVMMQTEKFDQVLMCLDSARTKDDAVLEFHSVQLSQQTNIHDCGVYVMKYLEA